MIIKELVICRNLTLNELVKGINIVKSNYIFNLETSPQITSYLGNELLWGRKNSLNDLDKHLRYWNNLENFKEIINYLSKDKYSLIASAKE